MGDPPDEQRHVLFVTADSDRRGAQNFAVALAGALRGRGRDVRTVALTPGMHGPQLAIRPLGPSRLAPVTLQRLRHEMRQAALVVGFGSTTLLATAVAGVGVVTPIVYRSIGDAAHWADSLRKRIQMRLLLARMERVVALWPAAGQRITDVFGVPSERIDIIPTAVDAAAFSIPDECRRQTAREALGLGAAEAVLGFVGALSPEKHVQLAIRTVARVPSWQLLVAGDGPLRPHLEEQAVQVAAGQVHFLGVVEDLQPVYDALDVLLLLSRTEGTPGVILEAGLSGVPTVATHVGGIGTLLDDASVGRLVSREATPGDVCAAVFSLLDTPAPGSHESVRTWHRERHDLRAIALQWDRLLTEIQGRL